MFLLLQVKSPKRRNKEVSWLQSYSISWWWWTAGKPMHSYHTLVHTHTRARARTTAIRFRHSNTTHLMQRWISPSPPPTSLIHTHTHTRTHEHFVFTVFFSFCLSLSLFSLASLMAGDADRTNPIGISVRRWRRRLPPGTGCDFPIRRR